MQPIQNIRTTQLGLRVVLAAAGLTLGGAAGAWALSSSAVVAKSPRALVLTRADLPVAAKRVAKQTGSAPALGWIYVQSARTTFRRSSHYAVRYRLPKKDVYSAAFVFSSRAAARSALSKLSRSLGVVNRRIRLPRLGDAQVTTYVVADALQYRFTVRSGEVVWRLDVVVWHAASRAEARSEALALARKQQARVRRSMSQGGESK
jgi:hypothetical protein